MSTAFTVRGNVQVAWLDTRREALTTPGPSVVADYFDPALSANVHRKLDVYTARISSDEFGNVLPPSEAVRVTQFRIAAEVEDDVLGGTVALEGEAFFSNLKLYVAGGYSFIGDYFAVAGQSLRKITDGKWENNAPPIISPLHTISDC